MQKIKAKKEVIEQITSKLKNAENRENKGNLGEISSISDDSSKLQASKNIFARGDFDEYKITDEELAEHEKDIEKGIIRDFSDKIETTVNYFRMGVPVTRKQWISTKKKGKGIRRNPMSKKSNLSSDKLKSQETRIALLNSSPDIGEIKPVKINIYNYQTIVHKLINEQKKELHKNKPLCKAINKKVVELKETHVLTDNGHLRDWEDLKNHIPYIPFISMVIKNGVLNTNVNLGKGRYEILARATIKTIRGYKRIGLAVQLGDNKQDNGLSVTEISIYNVIDNKQNKKINGVIKSLTKSDCAIPEISQMDKSRYLPYSNDSQHRHNSILQNSQNKSTSKLNNVHKSFDIQVTDITENNKGQKIQQVEKALDSLYQGKNFAIQHIGLDDSVRYGNVTLRIKDFDKESINKAVRSLSFTLDEPLKAAKGEAFQYKAQEELTNLIVKELTDATKSVYQFVIDYFDLPEMRIVQKSKLRWKGKVLYNPETGKPIEKSEWKKFTQKLEEFLNRTYSGIGQKIVLSSEALGRILNRLSKTNTLEAIKKLRLTDLIYKHRTFDWISNTAKNMTDVFGDSLTRDRQARVQAAIDSAAQRISKISDDMRNEVQQIIIDGVKDRKSKSQVSQALFDKMVGENRDFQRVADTEIQNNTTSAYIHEEVYHTNDGERVYFKRFEKVDDNTCKKCKELKGKVVLFSEKPLESENIKDEYTDKAIWEGKTTGIPFSTCHPYCRGTWVRYYPDAD